MINKQQISDFLREFIKIKSNDKIFNSVLSIKQKSHLG